MDNSDFQLSVNGAGGLFIAAGTNYNDINANATTGIATDGNRHSL